MEKVSAYTDRVTEAGEWRGGNPGEGQSATPMLSAYFNMLQRELVGVVEGAGLTLDAADDGQLLTAITQLIDGKVSKPIVQLNESTSLQAAQLGLVLIAATSAAVTVTLPASNNALGVRDVIVRRVDNGANRALVAASGSDKIKFHTHLNPAGYAFFPLMGAGDWWHLRSDGGGSWWPVGRLDATALGRPVFETTTVFSPGGWGAFNGGLLNRADWPWLWDHAQQSGMLSTEAARVGKEGGWTSGDGIATFRAPEGRGEFLRVLDDGRGLDPSRVAGSKQRATQITGDNGLAPAVQGIGNLAEVGVDPGAAPATIYHVAAAVAEVATSPFWGFVRPTNVAYPGRIKLI